MRCVWTEFSIAVNGEALFLDVSGAAWWPATRTLVFADLHFEKGSAYARSRQFLPPYDTRATLLRMAQANPSSYAQIEETVRQVAPFFGAFVLKEVGPGQTQLLWKDRYSDLLYYPHQLSDGTLRYICLATLLLQPNPPSTIIIDEPELGLHPYAIKLLASLLHEAAQHAQLIVSTQASLLLDELTPEQVIVVNHQDGESRFERLDSGKLKDWLQEYTLGQLWEKNELGGLP